LKNLVGFGADGCSTMLGKDNGVAVRLRVSSPSLISFHCPAHRLQLAILDIAGKVVDIHIELVVTVESIHRQRNRGYLAPTLLILQDLSEMTSCISERSY